MRVHGAITQKTFGTLEAVRSWNLTNRHPVMKFSDLWLLPNGTIWPLSNKKNYLSIPVLKCEYLKCDKEKKPSYNVHSKRNAKRLWRNCAVDRKHPLLKAGDSRKVRYIRNCTVCFLKYREFSRIWNTKETARIRRIMLSLQRWSANRISCHVIF
jgi:hypothetical protein